MTTPHQLALPAYVGPPTWVRIIMPIIAVGIAVMGVLLIVMTPSALVLGIIFAVAGLFFAVRLTRAGIVLTSDRLTIRGAVISRSIPKARIRGIDRLPSIDWEDEHGVTHSSLVFMLTGNSNGHDPNARMRERAQATLQTWLDREALTREIALFADAPAKTGEHDKACHTHKEEGEAHGQRKGSWE